MSNAHFIYNLKRMRWIRTHLPLVPASLLAAATSDTCMRNMHEMRACVQGLALNAPALGRHVTIGDRVSLVIINMLRMLCPLAQLIPSTPWNRITDDHAIPHRAESDAHYFNGALRVVTAHSLAKVWRTSCHPDLHLFCVSYIPQQMGNIRLRAFSMVVLPYNSIAHESSKTLLRLPSRGFTPCAAFRS